MRSIQKTILLSNEHIQIAAKTLTFAFEDYVFWHYMFPKGVKRLEKLHATFEMLVRFGMKNGFVYAPSVNFEGIVIWLNSEKIKTSLISYVRSGAFKCMRKIGLKNATKLLKANDYMAELHEKYMSEPHWYLFVIGVHPNHQKKGYGTLLINEMLKSNENNSLPYYTETNTEENTEFFKRFGFKIAGKGIIPKSEVANYCMVKRTL